MAESKNNFDATVSSLFKGWIHFCQQRQLLEMLFM